MSSRNEILGIQLKLTIDGSFGKVLSQIEKSLSKLNLDGLKRSIEGLNLDSVNRKVDQLDKKLHSVGGKGPKDMLKTSKEVEDLLAKWGIRLDDNLKKQIKIHQQAQSILKTVERTGLAYGKNYEYRDKYGKALSAEQWVTQELKGVERVEAAKLKAERDFRNFQVKEAKRLADEEVKLRRRSMAQINAQRKADRAQVASFYSGLPADGIAPPAPKQPKQPAGGKGFLNNVNISLGSMTKHLVEFYAIRTALFAVTGAITDSVRGFMEMNTVLAETKAITQATDEQMSKMKETALQLSTNSKFSAAEIASMMRGLGQAGVSSADMPQVTKATELLATATGSSADDATNVMTTALNVWKLEAGDATRVANTLTASLNLSKLSVGGLSTAFNYLASVGESMGMNLEEVTSIVATLTNQGVKASTVGTGTATLLAKLVAPTARMKKLFETYKISLDEVNPSMHSFADIVQVFNDRGVATADVLSSMDQRVGRILVASMEAGSEAFRNMNNNVLGTSAALVGHNDAMEATAARLNVLKSNLVLAVSRMFEKMGWAIELVYQGLLLLVRGATTLPGQLAILVAAGWGLVTVISSITAATAAWATATTAATGGLSLLAAALIACGVAATVSTEQEKALTDTWAERENAITQATGSANAWMQALNRTNAKSTDAVKINEQQASMIWKMAQEYEEFKPLLEDTEITYGELTTALQKYIDLKHEERRLNAQNAVDDYNENTKKLKALEQKRGEARAAIIAEQDRRSKSKQDPNSWGAQQLSGKERMARTALKETEEEYDKLRAAQSANKDQAGRFGVIGADGYMTLGDGKIAAERDPSKRTEQTYNPNANAGGGSKTKVDYAAKAKELLDAQASEVEKAAVDAQRRESMAIIDAEKRLANDQTLALEDRLTHVYEAKDAILKRYNAERIQEIHKAETANAKVIEAINKGAGSITKAKAEYDKVMNNTKSTAMQKSDAEEAYAKAKQAQAQAVAQKMQANANLQSIIASINSEYEDRQKKDIATLESQFTIPTDFDFKEIENRADKEIAILEALKEQAWTEDEIRNIEIAQSEAAEKALRDKYEILEAQRQQNLAIAEYNTALAPAVNMANEKIVEQQKSITEEIAKQNVLTQQKVDALNANPLDDVMTGAKEAWRSISDIHAESKELGADLVNTFSNGFGDAIGNMADSLVEGGNAWKSFSDTLGSVMADLGKMLMQYAMKLLLIWAIQKMVGMFAGDTLDTSGFDSNGLMGSGGGGDAFASFGDNFSYLNNADGGFIPLDSGERGKDSVPSMLMPGEYVIKKAAVDKYGTDVLTKINAMKYASGGYVKGGSNGGTSAGIGSEEGTGVTLNIINVVDPNTIPKTSATEILNVIRMDAAQNGATTRTIKARITGNM